MCGFMFHSLPHIIEPDDQLILFYPRCLNGNLTLASMLHIVTHKPTIEGLPLCVLSNLVSLRKRNYGHTNHSRIS